VKSARLVKGGGRVAVRQSGAGLSLDLPPVRDPYDTVIALELEPPSESKPD
jgi:hypothetical protein